jgi:hypothetical protein
VKFRVVPHSVRPGVELVEVFADDGRFIASITAGDTDEEIRVVSKHGRDTMLQHSFPPLIQVLLSKPNEPSEQWQADCRQEHRRFLTGENAHWCPAWGMLPIDETCKEFDTCVCFKALEKAKAENRDLG